MRKGYSAKMHPLGFTTTTYSSFYITRTSSNSYPLKKALMAATKSRVTFLSTHKIFLTFKDLVDAVEDNALEKVMQLGQLFTPLKVHPDDILACCYLLIDLLKGHYIKKDQKPSTFSTRIPLPLQQDPQSFARSTTTISAFTVLAQLYIDLHPTYCRR